MLTETGTTPKLTAAERWACELRDEFSLSLGHDCPFEVVPGLDSHGEYQVTVAGVVLHADKRGWPIVRVRDYVASKLAAPIAFRSSLEWYDHDFQLISFIGWMHAEHYTADPDGFARWLGELKHRPGDWTVEYIAFKAATR
jgi:hypothetical protein